MSGQVSAKASGLDVASVEAIRRDFPALRRVHRGHTVAYFDGPGGTQVPDAVVQAMSDYLLHHNANTHWKYPTSLETDQALAAAREVLADMVNGQASEISFGANMTTITFHLARALGRGWTEGDEVVVTELDHQANVAPWQALQRERGIFVRVARMLPDTGELDWSDLERAVTSRTKLVAVGAASNALGTISDVARAAAVARRVGALVFVDAVHYAPHELVDVARLDCDVLACSAYKFYGPHVGILWGRANLLANLDVPKLAPAPDHVPDRMETGTQNHEGIVGAAAAVDYLASLAGTDGPRRARLAATFEALRARGQALVERLWRGLHAVPGVTIYGLPPDGLRTPTLSFTVEGWSSDDVAVALAERGVFVSNGDFYATSVMERLGLAPGGAVRAGCACYSTEEEVDRLIDAVAALG